MVSAVEFAKVAESLVGARFRHHGRSRSGIDCAGIVFFSGRACGLVIEECFDYDTTPKEETVLAMTATRCVPRSWDEWQLPGRVIVMRQRLPSGDVTPTRHFAVTLGDGWAVHQPNPRAARILLAECRELLHSVWLLRGVDP